MTEQEYETRIQQLEQQIDSLQKELHSMNELLHKTETSRDEFKSKYFQFKTIFQHQTKVFYEYQGLTKQSQDSLCGIFKGTSFEEFLACGVQPGNIDALWEFSRNEILMNNLDDIEILQDIIIYFVQLYNRTNDSPVLAIQSVKTGDAFDIDLHIRTQDSKAAGTISKILLSGLTNAFTGEVIKKAVVEIN